jgi:hypothetical protein
MKINLPKTGLFCNNSKAKNKKSWWKKILLFIRKSLKHKSQFFHNFCSNFFLTPQFIIHNPPFCTQSNANFIKKTQLFIMWTILNLASCFSIKKNNYCSKLINLWIAYEKLNWKKNNIKKINHHQQHLKKHNAMQ